METMIPIYNTKTFADVYPELESFMDDYGNLGLIKTISDGNATTLYYLLYARYGNSPIANLDEYQFKVKMQATIWQFGPTWEKRLDIQQKLRLLTADELAQGGSVSYTASGTSTDSGNAIKNHAYNPGEMSSQVTTLNGPELTYIDQQNTDKMSSSGTTSNTSNQSHRKSKMDSYMQLWELLDNDVTSEFLAKFQKLFKQFVRPEVNYIYESEI